VKNAPKVFKKRGEKEFKVDEKVLKDFEANELVNHFDEPETRIKRRSSKLNELINVFDRRGSKELSVKTISEIEVSTSSDNDSMQEVNKEIENKNRVEIEKVDMDNEEVSCKGIENESEVRFNSGEVIINKIECKIRCGESLNANYNDKK
jgi:hypothetical protein